MTKSLTIGYVVIQKESGYVFENSFSGYRRNAKQEVRKVFTKLTEKEFREQFSVVRAVQTIEAIDWN